MTLFVLYVSAIAAGLAWYRRYSERNARRAWHAYFRWIHGRNV